MKMKPTSNIQHSTSNSGGIRAGSARPFAVERWALNVECSPLARPSSLVPRPSQSGVALVITVILLAVVTFMALTFLAVSRRERGAVTTTTDTATARLAADDALAAAEAQIAATTLATTNPYNFGLLVSTNYLPPVVAAYPDQLTNLWIDPRAPVYLSNIVTRAMENRFYLDLNRNAEDEPNGWVTNRDNFNAIIYDASGNPSTNFEVGDPDWIGVLQHPDQPYGPNNPFVARYAFVAVPIGNALDLNAIYNDAMRPDPTMRVGNDGFLRNQGVGSWEINLAAFLTDLNTNEWDLITDPYTYREALNPNRINVGAGFEDALALLKYRYGGVNGTFNNLASANDLFATVAGVPQAENVFPYDGIDVYSSGPVMTGFQLPADNDNTVLPWSGADNTNQFFDPQELFNTGETSVGTAPGAQNVTTRLLAAGGTPLFPNSTYNRYTYYRLLSQMGLDSAPEQDQINLNYSNAYAYFNNYGVVTNIAAFPGAETNLTPWTPLQFFTIAADKLLRTYSEEWLVENPSNYLATYEMFTNISTAPNPTLNPTNIPVPFGITNIPVYANGSFVYTPAIQRVLQLAANIYDADYDTNHFVPAGAGYPAAYLPSVFRPFFNKVVTPTTTNVYICGFTEVTSAYLADPLAGFPLTTPFNLENPYDMGQLRPSDLGPNYINVFGVPWIIGAKKGFPNFNEYAMESVFQLTRKLEVTRPATNSPVSDYQYNQMFNLTLSNQFGVECWNSYTNDYNRPVDIYVTNYFSTTLTNDEYGVIFSTNLTLSGFLQLPRLNYSYWPGYVLVANPFAVNPLSFQIPLNLGVAVIPTSRYLFLGNSGTYWPYLSTNLYLPYENLGPNYYPQPHWGLITTNNVQVIMVDDASGGIIDYVQLSGPNSIRDLTSEIITNYSTVIGPSGYPVWGTNLQNGVPIGLLSQAQVLMSPSSPLWNTSSAVVQDGIDGFRAFFRLSPAFPNNAGEQSIIAAAYMTNAMQSPYNPTATVVQHVSWQANDPLVHYLASDLNWPGAVRLDQTADSLLDLTNSQSQENLGRLNQRYMPWGGNPLLKGADQNPYNLALKDPLVWQSDDWDFPTYKLPTIGWLGRVHRGTPWQTVYLKSADILEETNSAGTAVANTNTWAQWTGDTELTYGQYYDAVNTAPDQDRLLFDLFTTAPNDNATRGQLSVNVGANDPGNPQAGLAAWSAVFSGVEVLSNNAPDSAVSAIVQHNGSLADYTSFPINPAGPAGANFGVGQIVAGINQTRTNFYNVDGLRGTFEHVGDILAVPQLSDDSPFLNWNNSAQQQNGTTIQQQKGISDEMYEWLPQQAMSLLRVSGTAQSPMRYVIYSYGQALKPAANGIYTGGGSLFGMITNYQVVSESATRTVVNFGSVVTNVVSVTNVFGNPILFSLPVVTNNTAQIERFNVLPPN